MTETDLMIALECCSDKDFARCSHCPLCALSADECRRHVALAALEYIRDLKKQ